MIAIHLKQFHERIRCKKSHLMRPMSTYTLDGSCAVETCIHCILYILYVQEVVTFLDIQYAHGMRLSYFGHKHKKNRCLIIIQVHIDILYLLYKYVYAETKMQTQI